MKVEIWRSLIQSPSSPRHPADVNAGEVTDDVTISWSVMKSDEFIMNTTRQFGSSDRSSVLL